MLECNVQACVLNRGREFASPSGRGASVDVWSVVSIPSNTGPTFAFEGHHIGGTSSGRARIAGVGTIGTGMASKRDRLKIFVDEEDRTILDFGEMDIWDGADLSLLRESLIRLIDKEGVRAVGIVMTQVKYVPSGFFGMMFDWAERGVDVRLSRPQPNVGSMLWFQQFFADNGDGWFDLLLEPEQLAVVPSQTNWKVNRTTPGVPTEKEVEESFVMMDG